MKLFLILPHYVLSYCAKLWNCVHHIKEWHCWNLLFFFYVFVFIVFHCSCKHLGYHKMLKPDCSFWQKRKLSPYVWEQQNKLTAKRFIVVVHLPFGGCVFQNNQKKLQWCAGIFFCLFCRRGGCYSFYSFIAIRGHAVHLVEEYNIETILVNVNRENRWLI
jgi:hypothetical protein